MKKFFFTVSIVLFLVSLFSFSHFNKDKKVIVLDVAHGGHDSGAKVNDIEEKQIVLAIAKKIKAFNKNQNIEIKLTRNEDQFASLSQRVTYINQMQPDLVISLHTNYNPNNTAKKGTEIYSQKSSVSKAYASKISEKFPEASISDELNLYILRNSEVPAIMLEIGFLSNKDDYELMTSDQGQDLIANRILDFLYQN